MKLDLRFSSRLLEDLWCQAVGAFVFQEPDMTKNIFSGLDKKMTGYLTNLFEKELWTGERGEKYLIATPNIIKSDKLLLHGLGRIQEFTPKLLEEEALGFGDALDRLFIREFGIRMPVFEGLKSNYPTYLEIVARNMVELFFDRHKRESNYILKVIFSVEKPFLNELGLTVSRLRKHFNPLMDYTIIVEKIY